MKRVLAIRHVGHEGAGSIETLLKRNGIQLEYWDIALNSDEDHTLDDFDGFLIMGGPMGVYECARHPFLKKEFSFVRKIIKSEKPVIGFCLGAQILAHCLDAKVYPGSFREIGWYPVTPTPEGLLDQQLGCSTQENRVIDVFEWHGDTFDLPKNSVRLFLNDNYANQAFKYGGHVYGFQFHFEITTKMIAEWLEIGAEELRRFPEIKGSEILEQSTSRIQAMEKFCERFIQDWLKTL